MLTDISKRFWAKVSKGENCWKWLGSKTDKYGRILYNRKLTGAHRISWMLHFGKIYKVDHGTIRRVLDGTAWRWV